MRSNRGASLLTHEAMVNSGLIEYVGFPDSLRGKYQCYTQADLTALRRAGCNHRFTDVQGGVSKYVNGLLGQDGGVARC